MLTTVTHKETTYQPVPSISGEYAVYEFALIDPAANSRRYYQLAYQPSLWSPYCVIRTWGRLGSRKLRSLAYEFEDEASAQKWLTGQLTRRLKRGYQLLG
jgi:predicted DNA-binding WGR domain protein